MTTSSSKKGLPPHWIVKTSRHDPSLSYYANVKTGQSTWKHPSLLKESELESPIKKKGKKKLPENDSEVQKTTGVEKQDSKSPKKAKFTPIGGGLCTASVGGNQAPNDGTKEHTALHTIGGGLCTASVGGNQEPNDGTKEHTALHTKQLPKDNKTSPVKFTIKKKNAFSPITRTDSSSKRGGVLHPSILLAQKIASRDSHYKAKRKGDDKKDKETTHDEMHTAKKSRKDKETSKSPVAAEADSSTTSKNDIRLKECNVKKTSKKAAKNKKRKRRFNISEDTDKSVPITESTSHNDEKEKTGEHKEDPKRIDNKEAKLYHEFIVRKSKLWRSCRPSLQDGGSQKTLEPQLYSDEHSEILTAKIKLEEPKEEAPVTSELVPYTDSLKVSKPVPLPVPSHDTTIYPDVIDMEIDEEELKTEIANFRGSSSYCLTVTEVLPNSSASHSSLSLYFVVDTNVLIGDIDLLQDLKISLVDGRESVVVVPYVALQEMDGLKKSAAIGKACQAAVRWCNQHFEARHPRVQGQTYSNYRTTRDENKGASADDLVRDCCLVLSREGLDVCLLTNDVNLRNKALMSSLSAVSAKDLKTKLGKLSVMHKDPAASPQSVSKVEESHMNDVCLSEGNRVVSESPRHQPTLNAVVQTQHKHTSDQKATRASCPVASEEMLLLERITASLKHTLSNILQDVMQDIYEDLWFAIIKHKPPWSLQQVFACWDKHWIAAMTDRFPSSMKELLAEICRLITASQVDVRRLMNRVQRLYSYFESKPYSKHILPVQEPSYVVMDMSEVSPSSPACSAPQATDSLAGHSGPHQANAAEGVTNVEKMINQVGAHITHFVALVLTAFGMQHNLQKLPNINDCESLTPDNARTSGINLHKVIMSVGTAITRCLNEGTSAAVQELGHLLCNFWSEACLPCPHLPFTECDLRQFVESPGKAQYLKCVLQELESLVQQLVAVLTSP